ncbi:hypothetical protein AA12717_2260 [Gluconacetobacter sacchari DSM 12717]|uniref:Uncharacterized protein n=3 Tax=Gluconacetobacter sacchari TaxID=92759 RepID=A0A7W4NPA8_9PROT|nr:hypothetical protein [Gluconacetobacter sacchari]GBQ26113.1 hypothetical protein AA12717_2260 [Gluconacetobacter sacchari DSM 12717]
MFHIGAAGPKRPLLNGSWHAIALRHDDPAWIDARDRMMVGLICCGLLCAFLIDMAILYFSMFRP